MKKGKNIINKMIIRYVFEIVLVIGFMVISYKGFTMNNLSEAREIASLGSNDNRDIQVVYAKNGKDEIVELDGQTFIDRGILYIKNPNKISKEMNVVIQLKKNDNYKIGDLNLLVDGEEANMGVILNLEDSYEFTLKNVNLDAYESDTVNFDVYSRVGQIPLSYSFKIVGSF